LISDCLKEDGIKVEGWWCPRRLIIVAMLLVGGVFCHLFLFTDLYSDSALLLAVERDVPAIEENRQIIDYGIFENVRLQPTPLAVESEKRLPQKNLDKPEALTIHDAVESLDINKVEKLLDEGVSIEKVASRKFGYRWGGHTPLHIATNIGSIEIVQLLLKNDADVNASITGIFNPMRGRTPLHIAVRKNHIEIVKLLLSEGAKMAITNV